MAMGRGESVLLLALAGVAGWMLYRYAQGEQGGGIDFKMPVYPTPMLPPDGNTGGWLFDAQLPDTDQLWNWMMGNPTASIGDAPIPTNTWVTPAAGQQYEKWFQNAGKLHGLPAGMLSRLAFQESSYRADAHNKGSDAQGLMQIVPRWHPGVDPFDPQAAIFYAAAYLRQMYNRFGSWEKALAGYNWGPNALAGVIKTYGDRWLTAVPTETYNYVTKIGKDIGLLVNSSTALGIA